MNSRDEKIMRQALSLARRGLGATSPNPMVGAVLVKRGKIIGRGWHHMAGEPHAEIEAIRDAYKRRQNLIGATLYVTLEPCSTHGRTPPCTESIRAAGIVRVVAGATDPNPRHRGGGFRFLKRGGIEVVSGVLGEEATRLNEGFNHWIVQRTPLVTVKAAMTLDGKIATASGESKWITSAASREFGMTLRQRADAILVGVNTILADDPSLTFRRPNAGKGPRRIVLDSLARTPLKAKVVSDRDAALTTIVVTKRAPKSRVAALAKRVNVLVAPAGKASTPDPRSSPVVDARWLLKQLGCENVTSVLVEGGGEVNASFLLSRLAQRVAFFYAPRILGGRDARRAVGGEGVKSLAGALELADVEWKRLGPDLLLLARVR
jgi:diaminohydroxyphosphoribosylaminopyrimidine deaminase/5-amino-6-(5-phosphoribosylamino)uracil reductase